MTEIRQYFQGFFDTFAEYPFLFSINISPPPSLAQTYPFLIRCTIETPRPVQESSSSPDLIKDNAHEETTTDNEGSVSSDERENNRRRPQLIRKSATLQLPPATPRRNSPSKLSPRKPKQHGLLVVYGNSGFGKVKQFFFSFIELFYLLPQDFHYGKSSV